MRLYFFDFLLLLHVFIFTRLVLARIEHLMSFVVLLRFSHVIYSSFILFLSCCISLWLLCSSFLNDIVTNKLIVFLLLILYFNQSIFVPRCKNLEILSLASGKGIEQGKVRWDNLFLRDYQRVCAQNSSTMVFGICKRSKKHSKLAHRNLYLRGYQSICMQRLQRVIL